MRCEYGIVTGRKGPICKGQSPNTQTKTPTIIDYIIDSLFRAFDKSKVYKFCNVFLNGQKRTGARLGNRAVRKSETKKGEKKGVFYTFYFS